MEEAAEDAAPYYEERRTHAGSLQTHFGGIFKATRPKFDRGRPKRGKECAKMVQKVLYMY